ncbi:phosphotransferase [Streptomyces sp. NPDC051104]|uniref:phosphotransferase n=1 Tax=Streptomyces sp. NPDC051104 TaxID=3155044 RepID=UPI00343F56C8
MPAERGSSPVRERAVEISGDPGVVEGPLEGYHHETYVIPLPAEAVGPRPIRGKLREPRSNLLWFDRRSFVSEVRLLRALQGRVAAIPELIDVVDGVCLQRFIEGRTLGSLHASGEEVPEDVAVQVLHLFRQLARVSQWSLDVEGVYGPDGRPAEGDSAGFLDRLIHFAEERVYRENAVRFPGLFACLGVDADCFSRLRRHVAGLHQRPFCLLHGDLHRENFVVDDHRRLWTIDWELAMVGDPLYDLATHLYLMRYPKAQHDLMAKRWCEAMEEELPGSSGGWEEDLPRLLDFKRAQSVFTDIVRAIEFVASRPGAGSTVLRQQAMRVRQVLASAARPLALESLPSLEEVEGELARWHGWRDRSRQGRPSG